MGSSYGFTVLDKVNFRPDSALSGSSALLLGCVGEREMGHMHRNWSCRQNLAGSFGDAELRLRSVYPLVVVLARLGNRTGSS